MRTSDTRAGKFSSAIGKILMALVFASMIGGIGSAPAFADDYHRRNEYYRHDRRMYHSRGYYPAPIYAPPPVVYSPYPYQSPGISLSFPIFVR